MHRWAQEREGNARAEDIWRDGEEGGTLWSGVPSPEPFSRGSGVVSGSQKQEAPTAALTLGFTVSIHHVNGVIAESRVYRPSRCGHLIHEIIRTRNSPNKLTGAKRKLFH